MVPSQPQSTAAASWSVLISHPAEGRRLSLPGRLITYVLLNATGYASQHIWCLSQAKIKWEDCDRKGIQRKNGGDDGGGSLISPDGVAPIQMVGVSASVIFPCTIKSRRRFLLAPADLGSPGKRAVKQVVSVLLYLCPCGRLVALSEEVLLKVSKCRSLIHITTLNLHGNGLIRLKHLAMLPSLAHLTVSFNDLTRLDDLAGLVRALPFL